MVVLVQGFGCWFTFINSSTPIQNKLGQVNLKLKLFHLYIHLNALKQINKETKIQLLVNVFAKSHNKE